MRSPEILSIAETLRSYQQGELTPVDVAQACIDAYGRREPDCQAWECFDAEHLLQAAGDSAQRLQNSDVALPLEGIPVAVKDIFNTSDFPTQMGSPLWRGFTPGNDARAVFNVKRAGGLIAGKTVTAEFAVHALGKTLNPHNGLLTPGTSSSGSAVAVATGMVPVAMGTQTAGSIVRPASFCGVWGCKPSFGLIPRTGMLKTTDSLDSVGFFVRYAADLAPVFDALRVHGRDYPLSHAALSDVTRQQSPVDRPWRVALVRPHVWHAVAPYAARAFDAWCNQLAANPRFEVIEQDLPLAMVRSHQVHELIYNRALAYYFKEEFAKAELISPIMYRLIRSGQAVSNRAYQTALDGQITMAREMDHFFGKCDVMLTLSTAGAAPPREQEEAPDSALMWTLTHLCVVSAPAFQSPDGLPFGLQLVARRYNDRLLFRFIDEVVSLGLLPVAQFPRDRAGEPDLDVVADNAVLPVAALMPPVCPLPTQ